MDYTWGFSNDGNLIIGVLLVILISIASVLIHIKKQKETKITNGLALEAQKKRERMFVTEGPIHREENLSYPRSVLRKTIMF